MIIIIYGFLQYMLFPTMDKQQIAQGKLQNIISEVQSFANKRLQYMQDASFIKKLQDQEGILWQCINNQTACDALDPILQDRKDLAQIVLKLQNISDSLMGLDEKRILASLNDYILLRTPNDTQNKEKNGMIQSIHISDPIQYQGDIYRVAIDTEIIFTNKDGLLSFINNIEKSIATNPKYRLLYIIDQIDYDVVKYNEEQKSNIALSLFYYNSQPWAK